MLRENRRIKIALMMARLSSIKTLAGFDFSFQPSLEKNRIMALAELEFVDRREVLHFLGPPGTGKSHLSLALGVLIWDYLHNHTDVVADQRKQLADEGIADLKKAIDLAPNAPNPYTYTNLLYREPVHVHEPVVSRAFVGRRHRRREARRPDPGQRVLQEGDGAAEESSDEYHQQEVARRDGQPVAKGSFVDGVIQPD